MGFCFANPFTIFWLPISTDELESLRPEIAHLAVLDLAPSIVPPLKLVSQPKGSEPAWPQPQAVCIPASCAIVHGCIPFSSSPGKTRRQNMDEPLRISEMIDGWLWNVCVCYNAA